MGDTMERRQDYIQLHERVAQLETVNMEIRDDVRAVASDVRTLTTYLQQRAFPELETRISHLEGWRRWVQGIAVAVSFIGGVAAWTWEHLWTRAAK